MDKPITVGILETGLPPEELAGQYGSYPTMFRDLLHRADQKIECRFYSILAGEYPQSTQECDAWLITGSKFGVYEDHPWIEPVSEFIRSVYDTKTPMIGICFGHQIMAQALGGQVEKSDKGWGLGVTRYNTTLQPDWMGDYAASSFAIQAFHQDQVVKKPATARVLAQTDFCPYAGLVYGEQALSFQGHPEFLADYAKALFLSRRGTVLNEQEADLAIKHVNDSLDTDRLAHWIVGFIKLGLAAKS